MTVAQLGALLGLLAVAALVGCADQAKPNYAKCIQARAAGAVEGAWKACNDAVSADATSESGRAAAGVLNEIRPSYEKARAEREAVEAKTAEEQRKAKAARDAADAKAAEVRRKAEADAQALVLARARQNVEAKFWSLDRDGECAGHGWPPYRKSYEGGTFAEDEMVALAAGCVHLIPGSQEPELFTIFCCPR